MELNSTMRLTRLSELGNGVTLYGLQYPGFHGCVSWCYVTIGPAVIVISQPERGDCGTSITNIWGEYFIRSLENKKTCLRSQRPGTTCTGLSNITGTKIRKWMKCF
jgi:hypothetical protein